MVERQDGTIGGEEEVVEWGWRLILWLVFAQPVKMYEYISPPLPDEIHDHLRVA